MGGCLLKGLSSSQRLAAKLRKLSPLHVACVALVRRRQLLEQYHSAVLPTRHDLTCACHCCKVRVALTEGLTGCCSA